MVGIGQVGVGYWGWNLLRNFNRLQNASVVGVCDRNPEVLERVRTQYPDISVSESYERLLEKPALDAVSFEYSAHAFAQ